jgi:hypothetical protein
LDISGADIKVWALPMFPDQERAAILEPAVDVDDGSARAGRAGLDAVTRLENEASELCHEANCALFPLPDRAARAILDVVKYFGDVNATGLGELR